MFNKSVVYNSECIFKYIINIIYTRLNKSSVKVLNLDRVI
jgi:hypothetical protein